VVPRRPRPVMARFKIPGCDISRTAEAFVAALIAG
jgi:hypothetical protein